MNNVGRKYLPEKAVVKVITEETVLFFIFEYIIMLCFILQILLQTFKFKNNFGTKVVSVLVPRYPLWSRFGGGLISWPGGRDIFLC